MAKKSLPEWGGLLRRITPSQVSETFYAADGHRHTNQFNLLISRRVS